MSENTEVLSATGYSSVRAFSSFSLCVLIGALMASLGVPAAVALMVALLPLLLRPLCLWPLRTTIILVAAVALSFFWGVVRKDNSGPGPNDLYFLHVQGKVHINGMVEEVRERSVAGSPRHDFTLIVHSNELLYPGRRQLDGRVMVNIDDAAVDEPTPQPGDLVEISGVLRKPRGKQFSFDFDEARWLASKGIFARLSVKPEDVRPVVETDLANDNFFCRLSKQVSILRKAIVEKHSANLGSVGGSLFSSMVLGDRVIAIDPEIKRQFALIGLSHLLAASGLNLTIIVTAALTLCRFFHRQSAAKAGWLETYVSFVCVLLFTSFAGAGPSVSRAAMMCLIALWARLAFVKLAHGTALALALLVALALDPVSVGDIGLQLSYGATFGIIYIYPLIDSALLKSVKNVCIRTLLSLVAVVVAAQFAVMPIQLHVFQQMSLLVVPANLLAEPVVVPITIVGFVSSICAGIAASNLPGWVIMTADFCCHWLDWLVKLPIAWLIGLAQILSTFPLASFTVARPQIIHVVLYYLTLALVLVFGKSRARLSCLILMLAFLLLCIASYIESPLFEVFCSKNEIVINQGNQKFFVRSVADMSDVDKVQSYSAQNYVRYLLSRGITRSHASNRLFLPQLVTIDISQSGRWPLVKIVSQPGLYGFARRELEISGSGEACVLRGAMFTPAFIPYCPLSMPFRLQLLAETEFSPGGYFVKFRL